MVVRLWSGDSFSKYSHIHIYELEEEKRNFRKLHNEKIQDLYSSPNMFRVGGECGMHWENNVLYRFWRGHLREGDHLKELGLVIGKNIKEIGWEDLNWINVAQDREKWQAFVKTVTNLKVSNKREISGLARKLLAFLSYVADRVLSL
jgi:hypothetical protein